MTISDATPAISKAITFFRRICSESETRDINVVMVSHIVDSARPFIPVIADNFKLKAVYAKRSSINSSLMQWLKQTYPNTKFEKLDRIRFSDNPAFFVEECFPNVSPNREKVLLVDIGSYFAEADNGPEVIKIALSKKGYQLIGIVEDTENGHKRYEDWLESANSESVSSPVPVYSVARSPLKAPENHLVGVAVTFSIEAILREQDVVLQSRRAGVIGFGPIGSSVAHALRNRGIPVRVCEIDPIRLAVAAAQGFHVHHYDDDFISFAHDLNLIVSSTGAGAKKSYRSKLTTNNDIDEVVRLPRTRSVRQLPLNASTIGYIEQNTFVASVTSSDDEIDLNSIKQNYETQRISDNVCSYTEKIGSLNDIDATGRHRFLLMMDGNAVNFAHGGVVGPAIQLLQGEIIVCMQNLVEISQNERKLSEYRMLELTVEQRQMVADRWLDQYLVENLQQS